MRLKMLIAAGVALAILTMGFTCGVMAAGKSKEIKAELTTDFQIIYNGKSLDFKDEKGGDLYPLFYNNRAYIPLRALAKELNLEFTYDPAKRTISLNEATTDVKAEVKTEVAEIKVHDKKLESKYETTGGPLTFEAIYPQIEGLKNTAIANKVNSLLKEEAVKLLNSDYGAGSWESLYADFLQNSNISTEDKKKLKSAIKLSYEVKYNKKGLLSIQLAFFESIAGMAHPYEARKEVNVDLNTGNTCELHDLFQPKVNYIALLNISIKEQLGKSSSQFKSIKTSQGYYLTENSLVICLDLAELGSRGSGFPEFPIKLSTLKGSLSDRLTFGVI